jgi:hypothetical protein
MMEPAATNAALARHYRLARWMTWAQLAVTLLGVVGALRGDWTRFVVLATLPCAAIGGLAMHRAKRLLDAVLAESQ